MCIGKHSGVSSVQIMTKRSYTSCEVCQRATDFKCTVIDS